MAKQIKKINKITVKNAEGDADTTATILIQNKIDYTPKVSVIIPVYNVEKYLRECLDSIINQTLKEIEIICVDDGSTDSSLDILKEYAAQDNRITVITQQNLHAGVARNAGLSVARGEYLSFLDSDDFFEPNMLEKTYNKALSDGSDIIVFGFCQYNDETKKDTWTKNIDKNWIAQSPIDTKKFTETLFSCMHPNAWTKLFKKDLFDKNDLHFDAFFRCNDMGCVCQAMAVSKKISFLDSAFVHYRTNQKNNLTSLRGKFANQLNAFARLEQQLKKLGVFNEYSSCFLKLLQDGWVWENEHCTNIQRHENIMNAKKILPEYLYNQICRPKVSVIMPVYNTKSYLNQTLDKLINQTLKDIEIICIDDGSTDGSLELLNEYALKDNRFNILQTNHFKAGGARNFGIKHATGKYIEFLDSDDWLEFDCLEKLYNQSEKHQSDICIYGVKEYDENTASINNNGYLDTSCYSASEDKVYQYTDIKDKIFRRFAPYFHFYNTDFFIKNELFFQEGILCGEDILTHVKSIFLANRICFLNQNLYIYRRNRPGSIMTSHMSKNVSDVFAFIKTIEEFLLKQNKFNLMKSQFINFACGQLLFYIKQIRNRQMVINFVNTANDYLNHFNIQDLKSDSAYVQFNNYVNGLKLSRPIIPVILAADDNYVVPLAVCLYSILENTDSFVDAYILSDDISDDNIKKIQNYLSVFDNYDINFIDMKSYDLKHFPKIERYNQACFARYFIPELISGYDKVIYSDPDVIFKGDITEYYNIPLDGYGVAATPEEMGAPLDKEYNHQYRKSLFKIKDSHQYFANGNLIIDCKYWKKHNITEKLVKTTEKLADKLVCPDLDVMNIVFENNYKKLHFKYCATVHRFDETDNNQEMIDGFKNPFIIHYSGPKKPWATRDVKYYQDYADVYNKMTGISKISVIVPVYNVEKYLSKCLDSVINQTYKNLEIICVNDGSTDGSLDILKEYEKKDKRIKIISQQNSGLNGARNTGLRNAVGTYVTFLDSDDWLDYDWVEKAVNVAIEHNADLVKSGYLHHYQDRIEPDNINDVIDTKSINKEYLGINEHNIIACATLYNRTFIEKNDLYFDPMVRKHEDILYTLKATFLANKIAPLSGTYLNYRRTSSILSLFDKSEYDLLPIINAKAIKMLNEFDCEKSDYVTAVKRLWWRTNNAYEKRDLAKCVTDQELQTYLDKNYTIFRNVKYPHDIFNIGTIKKLNIPQKIERALLVEINDCHCECLPGYAKYLLDLGYAVDVLINQVNKTEEPMTMFDLDTRITTKYLSDKQIFDFTKSKNMNNYAVCIFNSNILYGYRLKSVLDFINPQSVKPKVLCVEHRLENLPRLTTKTTALVLKKFYNFKNTFEVNPHYFGEYAKHTKGKIVNFIVAGNIQKARKNFDLLINSVKELVNNNITNFKVTVIGRGNIDDLPENTRKFFDIKGRVSYPDLYKYVSGADFFLPLLDPNLTEHDRYLKHGTSGSFQLIYGLNIPCLIANKFAKCYCFSSKNAVLYGKNNELYTTMKACINMYDEKYEEIKSNLQQTADKIYKSSLHNLQYAIHAKPKNSSDIKSYLIFPYYLLANMWMKVVSIPLVKFIRHTKRVLYSHSARGCADKILQSIQSAKKDIYEQLNNVKTDVQKQFDQLNTQIKQQQESCNSKFDQLNTKINEQQESRNELHLKINELNSKFNELNTKVENQQESCDSRFDQLNANVERGQVLYYNPFETITRFERGLCDMTSAPNFEQRFKKLVSGLAPDDVATIVKIIRRLQLIKGNKVKLDLFTEEEKKLLQRARDFNQEILKVSDNLYAYKNYLLPIDHFEQSVFLYNHGIERLDSLDVFKNKDILDIGGYIGDSVLMLSPLTNKKIYSFEATQENFDLMKKTIELNNIKNAVPVRAAVGDKTGEIELRFSGSASSQDDIMVKNPEYIEKCPLIKVDDYVREHKINVGLIKVDIEGAEQSFLRGARKTIEKYKPTLLISIYHNVDDFLDIKPMIESWNLGYKFKVFKPVIESVSSETLLICEQ